MIGKLFLFFVIYMVFYTHECQPIVPHYPSENYNRKLFQGDILIRSNRSLSRDRFATTQKASRWPNKIVPYVLDNIYSDSEKDLIRSAMDVFEEKTCIKWVERTDEQYYVEIYSDMGCYADLGRIGGVQSLSLETPDCMEKGVVMHEMMHSLGFMHEQSRPDRDDHVKVMWDNIVEEAEMNFEKLTPLEMDNLDLPYDLMSIMHYRAYMYAKDRTEPTLVPVDHTVDLEELGIGQKNGVFSDLDIEKINKFYEC